MQFRFQDEPNSHQMVRCMLYVVLQHTDIQEILSDKGVNQEPHSSLGLLVFETETPSPLILSVFHLL